MLFFRDCIDDFSPEKFTYTDCKDNATMFKCAQKGSPLFGRCFDKYTIDGTGAMASCNMNQSVMHQIGFWKTSFPSADYWR